MASARGGNNRHRVKKTSFLENSPWHLDKSDGGNAVPAIFGNVGFAIGDTRGV